MERSYNDNIEMYSTPEQVRASHILLKTEGKKEEEVKAKAEQVLVADPDCPRGLRNDEAAQHVQHGRLAGPVRAHQRHPLATEDLQVGALDQGDG